MMWRTGFASTSSWLLATWCVVGVLGGAPGAAHAQAERAAQTRPNGAAPAPSAGAARERPNGPALAPIAAAPGRMLVLPGVYNTRFQLRGFVKRAAAQLPGFDIEVRRWGTPFMPFRNLRGHERNVETAALIAAEIAERRRAQPDEPFYLVGYSGGGGMAVLIVAALPADVQIDRLILVAPAISPEYPLARDVLPKVAELVVNYASERDLQVGWGTQRFGTLDRAHVKSAGAVGFAVEDPKLVQWRWQEKDREIGHRGNHVAYLGRRWQQDALMPAVDLNVDANALRATWAARIEEQ